MIFLLVFQIHPRWSLYTNTAEKLAGQIEPCVKVIFLTFNISRTMIRALSSQKIKKNDKILNNLINYPVWWGDNTVGCLSANLRVCWRLWLSKHLPIHPRTKSWCKLEILYSSNIWNIVILCDIDILLAPFNDISKHWPAHQVWAT